jgi:hypothetical protein
MSRHRFRVVLATVGLLALALPFITAADTSDDAEGVGDAHASLLGAALEVEDLDGVTAGVVGGLLGDLGALDALDAGVDLALLDGVTSATTRNEPDARASMSPLRLGDQRPHDVEAGPGQRQSADAFSLSGVSALLPGVAVSPFAISADADEDHALALIEAVTASADVLGDGGLEIGLTEVVSEVTRAGAAAGQDLVVDDLSLVLGDILPEELLRLLPLDALLDLLEELDALGLLDDVAGLRDLLEDELDEVAGLLSRLDALDLDLLDQIDPALLEEVLAEQQLLAELEGLETTVTGAIDDLERLIGEVGDLLDLDAGQTIDDVLDALDELDDGGLVDELDDAVDDVVGLLSAQVGTDVESQLGGVLSALSALEDDGLDLAAGCTDALGTGLLDLLDDAERLEGCVDDAIQTVTGTIDGLISTITDQVDGLEDLLGLVTGLLGDLDGALQDLLGLVDDILGSVGAIAGLELLSADRMALELAATADAEGGATRIVCELGGLSVLGQSLGDASCDDGELTGPAVGAVTGALDLLEDVMTSLPGVETVDGLRLELLPEARESVETADDGTVTASAQAVLLELGVPSVAIDPSAAVEDLLDLPGLSGDLLDLDGELGQLLGLLEDSGLTGLLGDAEALVGQVTVLLGDVTGLLDDLDLPVLSETIRTPAVGLVLDSASEASFTAAQVDDPTDPDPTDPDPDDPGPADPADPEPSGPTTTTPAPDPTTPELPRTGGAFSLLGLLALAGAAGLRRTG